VNRTELVEAISGDTGLTRVQAAAALDALVYEITNGVRAGTPVRITGFGTFKLRERQARRGRNPQTGAPVRIKASKGIGFTPGVQLKADLNSRGTLAKPKPLAAPATKASATARKAGAKAAGSKTAASKPTARRTAPKAVAARVPARNAGTRRTPAKQAANKAPAKRGARRA